MSAGNCCSCCCSWEAAAAAAAAAEAEAEAAVVDPSTADTDDGVVLNSDAITAVFWNFKTD
mgnify:CR=1 FL=1